MRNLYFIPRIGQPQRILIVEVLDYFPTALGLGLTVVTSQGDTLHIPASLVEAVSPW
jgi:hypothetical protein